MNSYRVYNIEDDTYTQVSAPFPSFAVMAAAAQDDGVYIVADIISGYEDLVEWDTYSVSVYPYYCQIEENN
jgi:hypothetical protein